MESIAQSFLPRARAVLFAALFAVLATAAARAQNAVPIALTGWNLDMIFEVPPNPSAPSTIQAFYAPEANVTWAEAGVITGVSVNGFPPSRTFTSLAYRDISSGIRTNTQFQFQPYNQPNVAFLGGSGNLTMNLVTPARYKTLNILSAAVSTHGNLNHIRVTLGFTDRGPVDIILYRNALDQQVTFPAQDWGEAMWSFRGAIAADRVFHSASKTVTPADPLVAAQGGFGLGEAVLDLTQAPYDLQNNTLAWIFFNKVIGYDTTTAGIFAVSGTPTAVPQIPPSVTAHPSAAVRCEGQAVSFSASASGSPAPATQWQVSTDGGASFNNVPGATGGTLTFNTALAQNGQRFRAFFSSTAGAAASDPATLVVNALPAPPTITPLPASVVASSTGNQAGGPAGAASYAWTIGNGALTSAANLQNVTYTAGGSGNVTLQLTVANASGCTATNSVAVPTYFQPSPPTVTLHPFSQATCAGSTVTLTAAANGSPTPTVQWQSRPGSAGTFSDLAGQTATTLTFSAQPGQDGHQFRAVFTNPSAPATSQVATLSVNLLPTPPVISLAPRSVLAAFPGNQASGPAGAASYAWTITNGTLTSAADLPDITYLAGASGNVTLQLTVGNATGCTASTSVAVPIVTLPPPPGIAAVPLALTGWNSDLIFEVPNPTSAPSLITQFFGFDASITWAERGIIAGRNVNGLPNSRTFTSTAFTSATRATRTDTQFTFQPYTGANAAYLGTAGSVTLNLVTPAKYRSLNVLSASSRSQANAVNLQMILSFSDHAPVLATLYTTPLGLSATFYVPDWGTATYEWNGAMTADRVFHSANLTATLSDPLLDAQAGFAMVESVIDLTQLAPALHPFTLTAITFTKPAGDNATNAAVFAVSGVAEALPGNLNLRIADVAVADGAVSLTARGVNIGRGYVVQRSPDLFAWKSVDVFAGDSSVKIWSEPLPSAPPLFYRLLEY